MCELGRDGSWLMMSCWLMPMLTVTDLTENVQQYTLPLTNINTFSYQHASQCNRYAMTATKHDTETQWWLRHSSFIHKSLTFCPHIKTHNQWNINMFQLSHAKYWIAMNSSGQNVVEINVKNKWVRWEKYFLFLLRPSFFFFQQSLHLSAQ